MKAIGGRQWRRRQFSNPFRSSRFGTALAQISFVLAMLLHHFGSASAPLGYCFGTILAPLYHHLGSWHCFGTASAPLDHCYGIALALLQHHSVIALSLLWHGFGTASSPL